MGLVALLYTVAVGITNCFVIGFGQGEVKGDHMHNR